MKANTLFQVSMVDPLSRRDSEGSLRKLDTLVWAVSALAAVNQAKRQMPPRLVVVFAQSVPELFDPVEVERA